MVILGRVANAGNTMARFDWFRGQQGNWNNPFNWQQGGVPGAGDSVFIPAGAYAGPTVTTPIAAAFIYNAGFVSFEDAGSSTVVHNVTNYHVFDLVGSDLTIRGTLSNNINPDLQAFVRVLADPSGNESHLDLGALASNSILSISHSTVGVRSQASLGSGSTVTGLLSVRNGGLLGFEGSAQFTSIATNSTLQLFGNSYIADFALGTGSNSALRGLNSISGSLQLGRGAEIDTTGSMFNAYTGHIDLTLGGTLSLQGAFTNRGLISAISFSRSMLDVGGALLNSGEIDIGGASGKTAMHQLDVAGTVTNNGKMVFRSDTEDFSQDVLGKGRMDLTVGTTLEFDGGVSQGQNLYLGQNSTFALTDPTGFAATVHGFGSDDALLIRGFDDNTSFRFVENQAHTAGVLTVSDGGAGSAHIHLTGVYQTSDFHLASTQNGVKITTT